MRNEEVKRVLQFLQSSWATGRPLDPVTVAIWGAELADLDFDAVMLSLRRLLRSSKFRPSFAEIVAGIDGGDSTSASESFAEVWDQIGKRPPVVGPVESECVRRLGGWSVLGQWKIDDRHWHAKRYAEVYAEVSIQPKYAMPQNPQLPPAKAKQALPEGDETITPERIAEMARELLEGFAKGNDR